MQMLAEFKHVATGIGGDLLALPLRIGLISEPCLAAYSTLWKAPRGAQAAPSFACYSGR
jgi:hypothetical protein